MDSTQQITVQSSTLTPFELCANENKRISAMGNKDIHASLGPCVTPQTSSLMKGTKLHIDGGMLASIYISALYQGRTDISLNDIVDACDQGILDIFTSYNKEIRDSFLRLPRVLLMPLSQKIQAKIIIIDNDGKYSYDSSLSHAPYATICLIIRNKDYQFSAYLPGLTDQFEINKFAAIIGFHTNRLSGSTYSSKYLDRPQKFIGNSNNIRIVNNIRACYVTYQQRKFALDEKHKVELEELLALQKYRNRKNEDQYNAEIYELKKQQVVTITTEAEYIAKAVTGDIEAIEHIISNSITLTMDNVRAIQYKLVKDHAQYGDDLRNKHLDLVCEVFGLVAK